MNITKESIDQLTYTLTLTINEEDYELKVNTALNDYRKKAQIKGFRSGKAPMGMIKKMAGSSLLMQEIDKIVSESLSNYILEEKLNLLGQPLPSDKQTPIDPENQKEFQLFFDIAVAPEFELELNKKTKIPYYNITVDDKMVKEEIERYSEQLGSAQKTEFVDENSYVKANVQQLDVEGKIAEEGISAEGIMLAVDLIKDENEKVKIIGKKVNEPFELDIKKAYPNNTEIASMLNIDKDKVDEIITPFQISIIEITSYKQAEIDKTLFDKVLGTDVVNTEEEFNEKIKSNLEEIYKQEAEFRFAIDAKEKIQSKLNLQLPDAFLKKWLKTSNDNGKLDDETLENEYPDFAKDLQWQMVKNKISDEQKFEISIDEIRAESRKFTEAQFAQYGIPLSQLSEEQMSNFIDKNLEREQDRSRIAEKVIENKVVAFIKEAVKLDETIIDFEDFKKLYDKEQ